MTVKERKNYFGFKVNELDGSIHPGDDFFAFVNGKWLIKTKIPKDKSQWGTFYILREKSIRALKEILKELVLKKRLKQNSPEQKLRDLYLSGTNEGKKDTFGYSALEPYIKGIKCMGKDDIAAYISTLNKIGVHPFFDIYFDQDDENSDKQVLRIHQGGLTMPNRDYYLKQDPRSRQIRSQYILYIKKIFLLLGYKRKDTARIANTILKIETALARKTLPEAEVRDPIKNYNKKKISALEKEFAPFNWKEYFSRLRKEKIKEVIVDQKQYINFVSEKIMKLPLRDVKYYFIWNLADDYSFALNKKFRDASFAFHGKTIAGAKKQPPVWKQVLSLVDSAFGDTTGKIYVKKHFPKKSKEQMTKLVNDIKVSFKDRINDLSWMDKKTKTLALKKLSSLGVKIGYPKKWRRYAKISITKDSYVQNIINISTSEFERKINNVGKKPDRSEWHMTPATVNAYYTPNFNEIVFPAAILQPPFFDPNRDAAFNYGAIGSIIGHEISHAFDDSGSKFDHKGNMRNWWTKSSRKKFEKYTKVLEKQYGEYEPLPGQKINGKLTLGENIADLCGATVSFYAYQKHLSLNKKNATVMGGFTPEQRFFLGFSLSERGKARKQMLSMLLMTDPHSPSEFRVNGVVKNMQEFFDAFKVTKQNKLYLPKNKQAKIW